MKTSYLYPRFGEILLKETRRRYCDRVLPIISDFIRTITAKTSYHRDHMASKSASEKRLL